MSAIEHWGERLRAWAIPEEILAAAAESPYGFPAELFQVRAERAVADERSPSTRRALEALPEGGVVLDVGVGGGAASFPLAARASMITGVDPSREALDSFREAARRRGVRTQELLGNWPEVAPLAPPADVVVCHHVLYNVQDLRPFATALTERGRSRVVVEITDRHPLSWMNPLWERFHGVARPDGPTVGDAIAALRELRLDVGREDRTVSAGRSGFERKQDAIALVRRRLCLPSDRDAEIEAALADSLAEDDGVWQAGPPEHVLVTLWWPGTARD